MTDLILDTNVIIDFLRGDDRVLDFWRKRVNGRRVAVSQITRMELLSVSGLTESATANIQGLLQGLSVGAFLKPLKKKLCP